MNEKVLSQFIILLYEWQFPQLLEFVSMHASWSFILRAFQLACNMPTADVTNDNNNKTFQQALSSVLAVMLSDGGHFLIKLRGINLPYQDGSFVVVLLEV